MHFGDIVDIDFGTPAGSEPVFRRPAVVSTGDAFLMYRPTTVFVVPLTSTRRTFPSHVEIGPDQSNRLEVTSYALVEQMRAVSIERCGEPTGNIGQAASRQIIEVLAMIVGMA